MYDVYYNEQWSQETIERMIPHLFDRMNLLTMVVHARDHLRKNNHGLDFTSVSNAISILGDGLKNILDREATGLEWWTLRHRLTEEELRTNDWMDKYKTSWITAREAEERRNGKQR